MLSGLDKMEERVEMSTAHERGQGSLRPLSQSGGTCWGKGMRRELYYTDTSRLTQQNPADYLLMSETF